MPCSRRALLVFCTAALTAQAAAEAPEEDPAPFAVSRALRRFWPVVTDHPRALDVSAQLPDGGFTGAPLRRFNAPRPSAHPENPTRRHVGVDLFANAGDTVIAIKDGRIVALYPFLRASTGEMSWALLVAHDGYVANYGEVRGDALGEHGLSAGDHVEAGQEIAEISDTRQLHVETYLQGVTRNRSWPHGAPRPAGVLDPTALLRELARSGQRRRPSAPAP